MNSIDTIAKTAVNQCTEAWCFAWWHKVPHTQLGQSPTGKQHCEAGSLRWFW